MASDLFKQIAGGNGGFDVNQLVNSLDRLKSQVSDPNAMIQQLLSSGRVSQAQVNAATQKAQQLMRMLPTGGRR